MEVFPALAWFPSQRGTIFCTFSTLEGQMLLLREVGEKWVSHVQAREGLVVRPGQHVLANDRQRVVDLVVAVGVNDDLSPLGSLSNHVTQLQNIQGTVGTETWHYQCTATMRRCDIAYCVRGGCPLAGLMCLWCCRAVSEAEECSVLCRMCLVS